MFNKLNNFLIKHKVIIILFFIALVLRLVYFLFILHNFSSEGFYLSVNGDAVGYLNLAKQWLNYGTFQNLSGLNSPEVFRTPGYPIFIAFFYKLSGGVEAVIIAQNILFLISVLVFYKLIIEILNNKKIAIIASTILSLEPSIIYWNNQLITETLFAVTLLMAIYFSIKFYNNQKLNNIAISGLFLAIAIFIRPAGEYLAFIFVLLYLLLFFKKISFQKIILSILIFLLTFFFILSPWMMRNKYSFDSYSISNSSTIAFGKYFTAIKDELGEEEEVLTENNPFKHSSIVKKNTILYIKTHPLIFLKIYCTSLVPFLFGDAYVSVFSMIFPKIESMRVITDWKGDVVSLFTFLKGHQGIEAFIFFAGKLVWLFFILLSFLGLYFSAIHYKKQLPQLSFLILLIIYFSLASGVGSYSRFRFPVNPYIFIFTSIGIYYSIKKIKIYK